METRTQDVTVGIQFESNANVNFILVMAFRSVHEPNSNPADPDSGRRLQLLDYTANFATNAQRKSVATATSIGVNSGMAADGRPRAALF